MSDRDDALREAEDARVAADTRTKHLEGLVSDFVDEIRSAATKLRRLHTVMRDAVEFARASEDPALTKEFTDALAEVDELRRSLTSAADRFLTDTQPMWIPKA